MIPKVIVIAAGHGGLDSGAVSAAGHTERDQAIMIVDLMAAHLRADGRAVVIAPHHHDTHETIAWLNQRYNWRDVWALEVHRDSSKTIKEPAASLRCGIYHGDSRLSVMVAEEYIKAIRAAGAHSSSWARNQNVSRHGRLGWIAQPKVLSHLLEFGFMQGLNTVAHMQRLAMMGAAAVGAVLK